MPQVAKALEGLEPAELWRQFDAIRRIPRPSLHEAGVREYLRALASAQGWECETDEGGNLVLHAPGKGRGRDSSPLAIQGHMDMVCEKRPDVAHDFFHDPISLHREQAEVAGRSREILRAEGTTLGADNGIGCATALAIALSPGLDHPPLDLLFTADEEEGMSGAFSLEPGMLRARRLLNFDAEQEGSVYLSCAGGRELHANWRLDRGPRCSDDEVVRLSVGGLRGGHSGVDIQEPRANAIAFLVELMVAPEVVLEGVRLASCDGGGRPNAIAREAETLLWCARSRVEALGQAFEKAGARLRLPFAEGDPGLEVRFEVLDAEQAAAVPDPVSAMTSRAILEALRAQRHGVLSWSTVIPGLVETSNNIGSITTDGECLTLVQMARSSKPRAVEIFQERCELTLEASGAVVEFRHAFPGWEARTDNELVEVAKQVYRELFGRPPRLEAIHAGLECGVLGSRVPGLEMISFGPDIFNAHTPSESLGLASVEPFWRFAVGVVAALCD
ncbi:beta-Ala-His dipeptidase [Pseudenhygromyxa sp. WMMC2535]|uniref:beta-Ala-His dipeptidase n=1 Tax=Pseudenhygromyxa sp. WMMC2535 TaxID=2712867 RepID=UPI001554BF2E|nr:beta-Ala-His dipeptidase [Pseudenhygromyxa sp. WMMC2535]NVB37807.1 beta-Ala-His dipeptidase [Pseudenhygromyxa sp. WMMC2535]